MADSKIKKVIIPKSELPAFNGVNQSYTVRYRIVSEDKNRTSHWSPQYKIAAPTTPTLTEDDYAISTDSTGKILNVVWDQPASLNSLFDVYVKWDNEAWKYAGQESNTRFSTKVPSGKTSVKVAVQVPTFPNERFSSATIFETPSQSVVV